MDKNDQQREVLNKNFDELGEDKKEMLLKIGEKLLSIQDLIDKEKESE